MTTERSRRDLLLPAFLGVYAAGVALAPPIPALILAGAPLAALLCGWAVLNSERWLMLFFAAALLLPPLPFSWGDSGPHPAVAVAAIGMLAGVGRLAGMRLTLDLLGWSLVLYLAVLSVSICTAALYSGPAIAAGTLARVALFGVSVYVFFYVRGTRVFVANPFRAARLLFWLAAISALFACADFYFQFPAPAGFGQQFVWMDSGVYRRAQGLFYDASALGNFCAFFLVMIAVSLMRRRAETPVSRFGLLAAGVVFFAALMFSYSRASLLNVLAAIAVLLFLEHARLRLRRVAVFLLACIVAGAAAYALLPAFANIYWQRLSQSLQYFSSATGAVLSGRLDSWRVLVDFLLEHPWHALLGVGYKTLPYSTFIGQRVIADNMYISMLVETGLLGLSSLALLSFAILRASWKASRSNDTNRSFFGAWILCFWAGQLVQMMSQDVLTYWRVVPVYFCVLALAVRQGDEHSLP